MVYTLDGTTTVQLGSSGIILGTVDANNVVWRINQDGLTGLGVPGNNYNPVPKPRQRGAWSGKVYTGARTVTVNGTIRADTPADLNAAIDALKAAVTDDPFTVTFTESGRARSQTFKRAGETLAVKVTNTVATYSIMIGADDPRMFGTPIVSSTHVLSTSGGLSVPFTLPTAINSTIVSGQIAATNPGTETGPVVLRIDGPWPGGSITHTGTGLAFTFSASLALAAGEWLDIDMEAKTVLANGQASRRQFVTSAQWFGFDPGDNVLLFSATSSAPSALLTATQTPAWP